MPTYVYTCPKCSKEVEIQRSFEDEEGVLPTCDRCKVQMFRSWSTTPVHFKVRGFYTSDNKKES